MLRLILAGALVLISAGSVIAGTLSDVTYKLYHYSGGVWTQVEPSSPLPPGSNVPPNNQWRYDYQVLNKSPNALNAFYAFFNSDNVNNAGWVSGTAPANWDILKQGPLAPNYNFKIRYRTLVSAAKIPSMGTLGCTATFTWVGAVLPGSQNYDAVNDGGSESGVTVPDAATAAQSTSWGRLKALYD